MKERLIDLGLPIALGVVSVLIVITLFNLQPGTPERARTSTPAANETVTPSPPPATRQDETTAPPLGAPPVEEPAAPIQARTIPEPRTVMPGEIELERIGFSYAGVVGACNVELEPWRHVAVSRDLLAEYPCGSEVVVTLPEEVGGREGGVFIVGDTMNPIHERTVNIYVAEDEPAFEYGLLEGGVFSAP
jgi:3D (Asp-Asp-Asp) domain-containing protein